MAHTVTWLRSTVQLESRKCQDWRSRLGTPCLMETSIPTSYVVANCGDWWDRLVQEWNLACITTVILTIRLLAESKVRVLQYRVLTVKCRENIQLSRSSLEEVWWCRGCVNKQEHSPGYRYCIVTFLLCLNFETQLCFWTPNWRTVRFVQQYSKGVVVYPCSLQGCFMQAMQLKSNLYHRWLH